MSKAKSRTGTLVLRQAIPFLPLPDLGRLLLQTKPKDPIRRIVTNHLYRRFGQHILSREQWNEAACCRRRFLECLLKTFHLLDTSCCFWEQLRYLENEYRSHFAYRMLKDSFQCNQLFFSSPSHRYALLLDLGETLDQHLLDTCIVGPSCRALRPWSELMMHRHIFYFDVVGLQLGWITALGKVEMYIAYDKSVWVSHQNWKCMTGEDVAYMESVFFI